MNTKSLFPALLFAVALFVPLNGQAQKGVVPNKGQETKQTKYVDTNGNPINMQNQSRVRFVAERTLKDGSVMVYKQTKEDIDKLVKHLKDNGEKNQSLLNADTWKVQSGCFPYMGNCKNIDPNCTCQKTPAAIARDGSSISWCTCGDAK